MNPQDDPKSLTTMTVGIVSGLLLLITIFLLQLLFYWLEDSEARIKAGEPAAAFQALRSEQEGLLEGGYYWLDREQGSVALPIERAMERMVEKSRSEEAK